MQGSYLITSYYSRFLVDVYTRFKMVLGLTAQEAQHNLAIRHK